MKIYVASSWRNDYQPNVVHGLRREGHEVYDFKNPKEGDHGFHWKDVALDRNEQGLCLPEDLQRALKHPVAIDGFASDFNAMKWADACVLVLPCGQDATRNSISSLAQSHFSPKQLHGKDQAAMQDMLVLEKGVNWNDCSVPQRRGVCVVKETYEASLPAPSAPFGDTGLRISYDVHMTVTRSRWTIDENIPVFTQDREYVEKHLRVEKEQVEKEAEDVLIGETLRGFDQPTGTRT